MNEHREVRNLLGPFVMGELDDRETRTVEQHLEGCPACREEAESLRLAHEDLLNLAATSETPPPALKERVVAEEIASGAPPPPSPRARVLSRLAVAAAVLLLVLGAAYVPGLLADREVAAATLEPMGRAPDAGAEVNVRGSGENLEVSVDAWGLPKCEEEEYYELWFVEESGEHVSAGTFTVGESGDAELDLTAPQFATSYPRIGVTVEKDKDPRPSGVMMMGGKLREL